MILFKKTKNNTVAEIRDLTHLANLFETDKGTLIAAETTWGKTIWWKNNPINLCWYYTETYARYMEPFKDAPIKMMEIGICDGRFPYASCKMWTGFFSNLDLYSVDNFWGALIANKLQDISILNDTGVTFIYADQGSVEDWEEIKKNVPHDLDFLIEDGSHQPTHMMMSLYQSIDLIKSGGYYFMEDIQNPKVSRGWWGYDNASIAEQLQLSLTNGVLESSFLTTEMNSAVNNNFELIELILDPSERNYLAVFRRK